MSYCGPKGIPLHAFLGWPRESQDAALSWQAYESRRCSQCGGHPDEPAHYHPTVCPGCMDLQREQGALREDHDGTRGLHIVQARGVRDACPVCTQTDT